MSDTTEPERTLTDAEKAAVAATCPHTDCDHESTWTCSGWAYALDALDGVPDGWAKIEGQWVELPTAVYAGLVDE